MADVVELYQLERRRIGRAAARIVGTDLAEDVFHDAFLTFLHRAPKADRPGAWINRTARNRALNQRRVHSRPLPHAEPFSAERHLGEDVERDASRVVVQGALAALSDRDRKALWLRYFEELDNAEIGRVLGMRSPAVAVLIHRATKRLGREIVRRLAEAHGAGDCTAALVQMAGIERAPKPEAHPEPCRRCGPAWDEITALRALPAMLPALRLEGLPRVAQRAGVFRRLAERATALAPALSEPICQAVASVAVAVGLATAGVAAPPASVEAPIPVEKAMTSPSQAGDDGALTGSSSSLPDRATQSGARSLPLGDQLDDVPVAPPPVLDPEDPAPYGPLHEILNGPRPVLAPPDLGL